MLSGPSFNLHIESYVVGADCAIEPYESSAGNDVGGEEVGEREVGVTHPPRGEGAAAFLKSLCRDAAKSVVAARLLEQHFRQVQYSLSQSVA